MKGDILTQLQQISNQLDCIGRDMREEERVYAAELKDRLAKGSPLPGCSSGDAAVKHYNEWMDKAGMSYLKTK